MTCKAFDHGLFEGTVHVFACRDWGKSQITLVRMAGNAATSPDFKCRVLPLD